MIEFRHERFEIRRTLGAGGMGVVYAAFDRERGEEVALKTLRQLDPAAIYRFKREFRAVADASHPNLVQLNELVADEGRCFFTMELLSGRDFGAYVTGARQGAVDTVSEASELSIGALAATGDGTSSSPLPWDLELAPPANEDGVTDPSLSAVPARRGPRRFDEARLRYALWQLVSGVQALHELGLVHRDLKPSNVMVTDKGRLVILDMGLITWTTPTDRSVERYVAGTAAYMSPEQAIARPVDEASDWYSVGVMLYEALCGARPFTGSFEQIARAKQDREPTPPSDVGPRVPPDLDELCMELLQFDARARPRGPAILQRLGGEPPEPPIASETGSFALPDLVTSAPSSAFVGRQEHRDVLRRGFQDAVLGRTAVIHLHGASGMGKSALLRSFLDELAARRDGAVVLAGRCYERELVPYKGVDGVIDNLSRYLRSLPRPKSEAVLPRSIHALARVFPVLRQVEAVALAPGRLADGLEPREVRRRAFGALRDLLGRIGDRRPLVLCIDDLQWGDKDSAELIAELLRLPDPPSLLLVASYRSDEVGTSTHLQELRAGHGLDRTVELPRSLTSPGALAPLGATPVRRRVALGAGVTAVELVVGPLDAAECLELAQTLLGPGSERQDDLAIDLSAESRGNPFFVQELARHIAARRERARRAGESSSSLAPVGRIRVEDVLRDRVARLGEPARQLLETVAVAGRPLPRAVLKQAAQLTSEEPVALDQLRSAHLVRTREVGLEMHVEPYHDRIREGLVAELPDWRSREVHLQLALALEGWRHADPQALAEHFVGAGRLDKAGVYAVRAAQEAAGSLAFDRAAMLYGLAIRLVGSTGEEARPLRQALGEALAQAGRSREAAAVFAECAADFSGQARLTSQVRSSEEYLRAGHVEEGMAGLRAVLAQVKLNLPETPKYAVASLLARRAKLRLRGMGWKERDAGEVAPVVRTRIDACHAVSSGLGMIDPIRGGDFQTRGLLMALDSGDPRLVARALALEATYQSTGGERSRKRARAILVEARAIAERLDDPYLRALTLFADCLIAYEGGRWKDAREHARAAERQYLDHCSGATLEVATTRHFLALSLLQLGELRELARRIPAYVQDAEGRGDRFTATSFRNGCMNIAWLLRDDPDGAAEAVRQAMAPWSQEPFLLQHYEALYADVHVALYRGDGAGAWRRVRADWERMRGAQLHHIQQLHLEALFFSGRAAVLAAATGGDGLPSQGKLLAHARRAATRMDRERMDWAAPLADVLRAGALAVEGLPDDAAALLRAAGEGLEERGMMLYASAALWTWGRAVGGEDGRAAVERAEDWFAAEYVADGAAMSGCFAPGFAARRER